MLALINVLMALVVARAADEPHSSADRLSAILLAPSGAKAVVLILVLQHALTQPESRPIAVVAALLLFAIGALALRPAYTGPPAPRAHPRIGDQRNATRSSLLP